MRATSSIRESSIVRWFLPTLLVGVGLLGQHVFASVAAGRPFILLYPAIAVGAIVSNRISNLIAVVIGAIGAGIWFFPDSSESQIAFGLIVFVSSGVVVTTISHVFLGAMKEKIRLAERELAASAVEKQLLVSSAKLSSVLDTMSDAFFSVDKDWRLTAMNAQYEKSGNVKKEHRLGKSFREVMIEKGLEGSLYWINYHKVMNERVEVRFEDYYPTMKLWTEVRAYPTDDGGMAAIFSDITSKKIASYAIENERENFRNLFKQTPEMVCILKGENHVFEFVNEAHVKALGFDATGKTVREAQPESVEIYGILDEVFRTGKTAELHEIPVTVGDSLRYFNLTYAARRGLSGLIDGIMILGTEITEQVVSRRALEQSQHRYQLLFDFSPLPKWVLDAETQKFIDVNQAATRHYGYSRDEFLRLGLKDIELERRKHKTKNGDIIEVEVHSLDLELDSRNLRIDAVVDVSDRVRAQNAIQAAAESALNERRTLEEVLDQTSVPLALLLGRDHRVAFTNSTYNELFSIDKSALGRPVSEVFPDAVEQGFIKLLDSVFDTGNAFSAKEAYFKRSSPDGKEREFYLDFTYAAKRKPTGEIEGVLAAIIDVTDRVIARKELEEAKLVAERANQLKSAFLANMSHEIRTPLGAMLGFGDLLRDPGLTPTERANYIDILTRNGENLSFIINDILDLSKVEAGHLTLEFTDVSPDQIGADVVSLLRVKAKEKEITLEYSFDESSPKTIVSDPVRVRQIILNVVANALKFTQFGSVKINSYGCKSSNGRDAVCFDVTDTGIGIPKSQVDKIFEMFVQADGTMTRRFGGTGLGLALSRRLARALGGDIEVTQTKEGVGSTFRIQIESQPDKRTTEKSSSEARRADINLDQRLLEGVKILVVDDAPDNQQLIWRYLTKQGALVESAENGLLGYRAALSGEFDLVLMDIQMPVMDGYTATSKLRENGFKKPIVALTAHAMSEVRQKSLSVGYTDHLTKPINPKHLIATIVDLIERH